LNGDGLTALTLPPPSNAHAKPKLSVLMFQRSADLGLGIPFNIAFYALLTHMIAHVTGTDAHELIIQLGDAHVYRDHVTALEEQLEREPRPFPKLRWAREGIESIDDVVASDIVVEGYNLYPSIAMKTSVSENVLRSLLFDWTDLITDVVSMGSTSFSGSPCSRVGDYVRVQDSSSKDVTMAGKPAGYHQVYTRYIR
jgi:hypothetical protein